jgi:alpha/beta hydrolase family protein
VNPTLLMVHSPVVGPSTWTVTANVLRKNGFRCEMPDLRSAATGHPPYYPNLAAAAAKAVDDVGGSVVLVGHSGAGALLPAIADILGARSRDAVFVDALLPHPGRSWFDTKPPALREQLLGMATGGVLPPWHEWFPPGVIDEMVPDPAQRRAFQAEIPRLAPAYFDEPAPVTGGDGSLRCALLRFSAAYDDAADEAELRGWWVARKDWDHLRMITAPDAVAEVITQAISATRSR